MWQKDDDGVRTYGCSEGVLTQEFEDIMEDLREQFGSLDQLIQLIGEMAATHAEELREDAEEVDERAPNYAANVARCEDAAKEWQDAANVLFAAARKIMV